MEEEVYFVAHGGEVGEGSELYFTKASAIASQQTYIDAFDRNGYWVTAYKLNDDEVTYTTDF